MNPSMGRKALAQDHPATGCWSGFPLNRLTSLRLASRPPLNRTYNPRITRAPRNRSKRSTSTSATSQRTDTTPRPGRTPEGIPRRIPRSPAEGHAPRFRREGSRVSRRRPFVEAPSPLSALDELALTRESSQESTCLGWGYRIELGWLCPSDLPVVGLPGKRQYWGRPPP